MTIPTKEYHPGTPSGSFDQWSGGVIDADDMVNDIVDLLKPFFPASTSFDFYEIFTKATATADSILNSSATLSQVGTSVLAGWSKAAEAIWSFKSSTNGIFKISLLDFDSGDGWDKITFSGLAGDSLAFVNYMYDGNHGWAARDDGQPNSFLQLSFGLNKALRRKYNMN